MNFMRHALGAAVVLLGASLLYVVVASPDAEAALRLTVGIAGLSILSLGLCIIWNPKFAKEMFYWWPFI